MKKSKIFLVASLLTCALGLALFHHVLICFGVQRYVEAHLPESQEVSFSYTRGHWDQGDFVFQGVTLHCSPKAQKEGIAMQVDNLRFSFRFRLFPFQFSPKFTFSKPELDVANMEVQKKEGMHGVYQTIERQLFHIPISVEQGEVRFGKDRSQVAYFSFESAAKNLPGSIVVSDSLEGLSDPKLSASFSKGKAGVLFDFRFNDLRLDWTEELMALFYPKLSSESVKINEGALRGHIAFGLRPSASIDYLRYNLDIRNLKVSAPKWGVDLAAHHVHWKEHSYRSENGTSCDPLWLQLLGEGELACGVLTLSHSKTGQPWGNAEIGAKVAIGKSDAPSIECHGIFHDETGETPFQIAFEARRKEQVVDHIVCDFHFFSSYEGKIHTEWAWQAKEPKQFQVAVDFTSLNHSLITFMQGIAQERYPSLHQLSLESGLLSGESSAYFSGGKLQRLDVRDLRAEQVRCFFPEKKLIAEAKQLIGSGEFDWSGADFFDGTFWELKWDGGAIQLPSGVSVKEVEAHIAMHDQYVKPSSISGVFNGVEGEVHFEGLYSHLNFDIHCALFPDQLRQFIDSKGGCFPPPVDEKLAFDLHGRIKSIENNLSLSGTLEFLQTHGKSDHILFELRMDILSLIEGEVSMLGLKQAFIYCDFEVNHLSDHALNLSLWFAEMSWLGKGTLDVKGAVTQEALKLKVDPTYFTLVSPDVTIEHTFEPDETCSEWSLAFDFKRRVWQGELPLRHVSLEEKPIGLHFSPFDADLKIDGSLLTFRSVSAFSLGVLFQGEVVVDYGANDRIDLKITTSHIEGSTEQVSTFFRQFRQFAGFSLPIEGRVLSHPGEMELHADLMGDGELLKWNITLHLEEGRSMITPNLELQNLAGTFTYNGLEKSFNLSEGAGEIFLSGGGKPKRYHLNIPSISLSQPAGHFQLDARLETTTYDILCLKGEGKKEGNRLSVFLDPEKTHFFGTKGSVSNLIFEWGQGVRSLDFNGIITASDLGQQLEFLSDAGFIPFDGESIRKVRMLSSEGEIMCAVKYDHDEEHLSFEGTSEFFSFGTLNLGPLSIRGLQNANTFHLKQCEIGGLRIDLEMGKQGHRWNIPYLGLKKKDSYCYVHEGTYDQAHGVLSLSIDAFALNLETLIAELPFSTDQDWSYLAGKFQGEAVVELDLSHGMKDLRFSTTMKVAGEDVGKGHLSMECSPVLKLSYDNQEGLQLKNGDCLFLSPTSNQIWAKAHFEKLTFYNRTWKGEMICLTVPPEMIHYLGATGSLPFLGSQGKMISIGGTSVLWDNQMEVTLDFEWGETFRGSGRLKEGYYWVKDQVWYLNDFTFAYTGDSIDLSAHTFYNDLPFDLTAHVQMHPAMTSQIVIQEALKEEISYRNPLTIVGSWRNRAGFVIDCIEGHLLGMDVSLTYNPKEECENRYVLSGGVQIDFSRLAKVFPLKLQEEIAAFEVGKGYELVGDLFLGKERFQNASFQGYFRGKHFHLFGSEMETLLSEVTICADTVALSQFNLSDQAGIFSIKEMLMNRMCDGKWILKIPKAEAQDFRPSLLKKIGKYRGRIKPLTIRQLHFNDICGTIGVPETFVGKGDFHFINTFKRDYTLLDIPLEILGRLGLDMGLLVPTRGKVNFVMVDGKVYFVDLMNSYSEGKRSEFFLASDQPSYVDFDGNLNLNIRMKQYVLLKLTQPFILSIGGTFENPRYSLR